LDKRGSNQPVCSTSSSIGKKKNISLLIIILQPKGMAMAIIKASTNSILLSALKTSFPMERPMDKETPGAWNFNQASIKLIAETNPIHIKAAAITIGVLAAFILLKSVSEISIFFSVVCLINAPDLC
jgi:hypothetical protein